MNTGFEGFENQEIMESRDFYEIGILLDQPEAETYIKFLNLLFNNMFHKNNPTFVHRLAARPLMANSHMSAAWAVSLIHLGG